jgi:AraC family transcriptional regulator
LDELERALCAHLTNHYGVQKNHLSSDLGTRVGGLSAESMRHVISALEDQPERDWRLGHLAIIASLSPDHLIRAFKQSVGTTPHRYLMRVRLNRALSLLQTDHEVLISDVAKRCGFVSESHFSTSFKTVFGMRPSAVVRARKLPG